MYETDYFSLAFREICGLVHRVTRDCVTEKFLGQICPPPPFIPVTRPLELVSHLRARSEGPAFPRDVPGGGEWQQLELNHALYERLLRRNIELNDYAEISLKRKCKS